jgi:Flp pilus assembly protein CpaB
MKSRGMVIVLAFLLAAGATGAVYLYVSGVKEQAKTGGEITTVIVSKADIAAGTDLDPLIEQGNFREAEVATDTLVVGAVTQLSQLKGQTATAAILAGEQIPTARLSSGALPGGALGQQKGYEAATFQLSAEQVVGPALQRGAHVTIYAAFDTVTLKTLKTAAAASPTGQPAVAGVVMPIVQDVRVLDVVRPGVAEGQQATDQGALVTLELTPTDLEKVIFAQQNGTPWLGLLAPNDNPNQAKPIDFLQLSKKS